MTGFLSFVAYLMSTLFTIIVENREESWRPCMIMNPGASYGRKQLRSSIGERRTAECQEEGGGLPN